MTKVYFYCRDEDDVLQEDVVALAEGFRELGIDCYGNCDYWREAADDQLKLIRYSPDVRPDDCDIVVVGYFWPHVIRSGSYEQHRQPLPEGLFRKGRPYATVYMDHHDGHETPSWSEEYRSFDLILRAKLNKRTRHPANLKAWALGLNNRIIRATEGAPAFKCRQKRMLVNFGASHHYDHPVRIEADRRLMGQIGEVISIDRTKDDLSLEPADPYDALMWRQTGYRYSRSYYERIKDSRAVACFCGDLIPSMPSDPSSYLVGGNRAKLLRKVYELISIFDVRPRRSIQWDSFRFWETLAAGSLAVNIDLDHYGVDLPVMPVNGVHYLGVAFDRPLDVVARLNEGPEELSLIASEGRRWAVANYSPQAQASRLLSYLGISSSESN